MKRILRAFPGTAPSPAVTTIGTLVGGVLMLGAVVALRPRETRSAPAPVPAPAPA